MRNVRIDSLKGLLISLVVLGHCLTYGEPHDEIKTILSNWIYIFHMPLFVILSGYFTHVESKNYWERTLLLLESYVVFQIIKGWLSSYSFIDYLTVPASMMWYLWALLLWRIITFIGSKCHLPTYFDYLILILLFIGGLSVGFVDKIGVQFALSRLFVFAPFFWLGYLLQKKDVCFVLVRNPIWISLPMIIAPIIIVTCITNNDVLNVRQVLRGVSGYGGDLHYFFGRVVWYVLALMMSIGLTRIVYENKVLSEVGCESLKYYLFHGVVLMVMKKTSLPWPWYMSFVYWSVIMSVFYYFNRTKFSSFIIHPISNLIGKTNKKNSI